MAFRSHAQEYAPGYQLQELPSESTVSLPQMVDCCCSKTAYSISSLLTRPTMISPSLPDMHRPMNA
jgi:hypothetical protein